MNFKKRKEERTKYFFLFVYQWRLKICSACNGSGYYDSNFNKRIPKCGLCKGTGKVKYKWEREKEINH